ncbi:hypothetical protein H7H78_20065 [Mycobacterium shinjukuense]|uniref:hypothetical protein n=1 Tax=Mycobacterium shinjukuense TaxID=398694 RepID=UPI001153BFD8|nr:hypothetical protein [Mycobacterium shinjukuense]MCV6987622.1 hypothetical protein [Mycobacterium shinjukuense]
MADRSRTDGGRSVAAATDQFPAVLGCGGGVNGQSDGWYWGGGVILLDVVGTRPAVAAEAGPFGIVGH